MLGIQILFAVSIAVVAQIVVTKRGFKFLLAVAVASLLPQSLTGHSGGRANHQVAVFSWGIHIVSVTTWTALILALVFLFITNNGNRFKSTQIVSRLSLLCFFGTLFSGVINGATRINTFSVIPESDYGRLLILKIIIFSLIALIAIYYRTWLLKSLTMREKLFARLLGVEIFLLALGIMFGVLLSQTQLPVIRVTPR